MSLSDSDPMETPPNRQASKLLDKLIKQAGLTRKSFLDQLAELGFRYDEDHLKNWGREGRSFLRDAEALRAMVKVLIEARTPADPKRCTALQALEFLGLAGLPSYEFRLLANLFNPDEFNTAIGKYFQIETSLSSRVTKLTITTDVKEDLLAPITAADIANKSNNSITTLDPEARFDPINLNNNYGFYEAASTTIYKLIQKCALLMHRITTPLVVASSILAISFILGGVIYFRRLHPMTISYTRGVIPLLSPADHFSLNPAITWNGGGALDSSYALNKNTGSLIMTADGHTILAKERGNNETAPLMLLPIQGDFTAQVKIVFRPDSVCCKHAGIGVGTADMNSWIRISRDHLNTIQSDGLLEGRPTNTFNQADSQDWVWFKIERRGDHFTLSYSSDKVKWTLLRRDYAFPLSENTELFLFVYSAHQSDKFSAEFSDLSVE